jgi:hypothetical protein
VRRPAFLPPWLRLAHVVGAAAVVVITLHWVNTRVTIVRANQDVAHPVVPSTYYVFHAMAQGLREGRIGQVDLAALQRYDALHDPWAPFERLPPAARHVWVSYYTLDIGYAFIVEAARLAFRTLPDNHLRALALQLAADAATLVFVFFLFSQWNTVLGFLAAYLYASNNVFQSLVSFPFYYYWDIPLAFVVVASLLMACRGPAQARAWLMTAGAVLGAGVWLRGSWWPIAAFLCAAVWLTPALRKHLLPSIAVFALIALPQVARSSWARGTLTFSTRTVWHVALVGLGYYPNPYGLEAKDEAVFALTRDKYGVQFRTDDYQAHDRAARTEFFAILRSDPGFVIRSIAGRLLESIRGSTTVLSFPWFSNVTYRILCLVGLGAMWWRGSDRRFIGLTVAGVYAVYVSLTCLFYFVSLAYDNVTQVVLFVLFLGLADSILCLSRRVAPPFASTQPAGAARL